jgi:hypothetical protein
MRFRIASAIVLALCGCSTEQPSRDLDVVGMNPSIPGDWTTVNVDKKFTLRAASRQQVSPSDGHRLLRGADSKQGHNH